MVSNEGVLNKSIDYILSIDTFEKQFVGIKCMLQSSRLGDHMKTIGIEQSSFARSSFDHRSMNYIKKIYQHAVKCNDQQNLKDIIDSAILSTPEGVTDNSPNVHMTSTPVKKQLLGNHCVYSQIYWLLNLQQPNVVLWLKNTDANP